jgi:hypothetical protein
VGKSSDIDTRIGQHQSDAIAGRSWLRGPNLEVLAPWTLGTTNDLEAWERAETLQRMLAHGVGQVRGWRFTDRSPILGAADRAAAVTEVCERFDRCRRCGAAGHFVDRCSATDGWQETWARL